MTERFVPQAEKYDKAALHEAMAEEYMPIDNFRTLLRRRLPKVPVADFLDDFAAQDRLQELFDVHERKLKSDAYSKETPVIILKAEGETDAAGRPIFGGTIAIEPRRFRLADPAHIYYFTQVPELTTVTVNEEQYEVNPLNRVPVDGGLSEQYDYASRTWKAIGKGRFRGAGKGNNRENYDADRIVGGITLLQ
jgi:hypothetical protein